MTDEERAQQLTEALGVLLSVTPLGVGPVRMEGWNEWAQEQREAYTVLQAALRAKDSAI